MVVPEPDSFSEAQTTSQRGDIADEIRFLVPSAEPAVVFSSLARLCVPLFSDRCTIDITENDYASYRISYPPLTAAPSLPSTSDSVDEAAGEATVRTRVESAGLMDGPGYSGVITHSWRTYQPTPTDVSQASMMARHAVTTIYLERLNGDAHHDHETIDQLRTAVLTNRDIGVAMGILMTTRNLSQDEAFSALNTASENAQQKLSDIALDIIEHGTFSLHQHNRTGRPSRSPRTNLGASGCVEKT